jgi:hypothetical protein
MLMFLGLAAPLAAIAFPAAPAAALDPSSPQFTVGAAAGVTVHRGTTNRLHRDFRRGGRDNDGDRPDRRRHRDNDELIFLGDREYQGDTAWRHNSFNDWWHERPHRSFPRWVQNNENCERQWWSGGVWRC